MDFGIASLAEAPTLTAAGEVLGTLAYMSPEQAEGEPAGPESDVYSLALTVYECLAGENPVAAATPAATARRIGLPISSLREERPDLPEGLIDVIDACLEPDPRLRPCATELAECLDAELDALDPERPIPPPAGMRRPARSGPGLAGIGIGRIATLTLAVAALVALAGPLAAGGTALVLAALTLPLLLIGVSAPSLLAPLAPILGYLGAGPAAAALGAAERTPLSRAVLGAASWFWLAGIGLALGTGPDLGIGAPAPSGWAADPSLAVDTVLIPQFDPGALLGALLFALAAVALGWVLSARHVAIALLGALLWAAALEAALELVAGGALAGRPALVVATAAVAVAIEFRVGRVRPSPPQLAARREEGELSAARLSGHPA